VFKVVFQYFKLLALVVKYGRLKHSNLDFNANRSKSLREFQDHVPKEKIKATNYLRIRSWLLKNPYSRSLIAQTAFIKSSFSQKGGHLETPFNLAYIRIPKSASTSLSWMMLQCLYPPLKGKDLSADQINFLTDANLKSSQEAKESDLFFSVVRNPFARIVSVYRDFFYASSNSFIYQDYLFGIFKAPMTFKKFVKRLEKIPDTLKDQHLKPQHYFLEVYKQQGIFPKILKLEDPKDIQTFLLPYNLMVPLLNTSSAAYHYMSYYDEETTMLVNSIYHIDIELFGYTQIRNELEAFVKTKKNLDHPIQV
jgi:hypothetical protein